MPRQRFIPRQQSILARAYERTYQRAIDGNNIISSIIAGFLGGEEIKTKKSPTNDKAVILERDKNRYNRFEAVFFSIPRVLKNTAKLFTEFVWYVLEELMHRGAVKLSDINKIDNLAPGFIHNRPTLSRMILPAIIFPIAAFIGFLSFSLEVLSRICFLLGKIDQSITSPLNAIKDTYNTIVPEKSSSKNLKILGGSAAFVHGVFSLAVYTTAIMFILPVIAPIWIQQLVASIVNTPVIGTVTTVLGTGFVAIVSVIGLSIASAITATATTVAGTTLLVVPISTASRVGLHKLFTPTPRKRNYPNTDVSSDPSAAQHRRNTNPTFPYEPQLASTKNSARQASEVQQHSTINTARSRQVSVVSTTSSAITLRALHQNPERKEENVSGLSSPALSWISNWSGSDFDDLAENQSHLASPNSQAQMQTSPSNLESSTYLYTSQQVLTAMSDSVQQAAGAVADITQAQAHTAVTNRPSTPR